MLEIYVDGSCRKNGSPDSIAGVGIVGYHNEKLFFTTQFRILNKGLTNNQAEYIAVIQALEFFEHFPEEVIIYSDSQLVINQIAGEWKIKDKEILSYVETILYFKDKMNVSFKWVPRSANEYANKLAQDITEGIE